MTTLRAADGYRLWASRYDHETAVSSLEDYVVTSLGIDTAHRSLLDVGCGTARRLHDAIATTRLGIDLVPEMLVAGARGRRRDDPHTLSLAAGDVCALPVTSRTFDVVWFRLAIGHVATIDGAYAELARVCREGGIVIVTDVAPEAVAAGHRRTFRDAHGALHELEHHVHPLVRQIDIAARHGLALTKQRVGVVDERVRHFYEDAGRLAAYHEQCGLPLVVVLAFRRVSEGHS